MLVIITALSCTKDEEPLQIVTGLQPVYLSGEGIDNITSEEPGQINQGSKIYIKSDFVYIVEHGLGVHIIDNSNPSTPSDIRFLRIAGITDVAIRNNTMYANQQNDIVAINITDVMNIAISKRIEDVYELDYDKFPIGYQGYFECVDESKGIVVAWEETTLENPKCRR